MNLESVQAEIRQRHPWEAADLGVAMARREWKALLSAWCLLAVPLMILLVATLHRQPFVVMTLFWWLKPLLSVMPLFTLSRRLFGVHPSRGEMWRAAGSWLLRRGWLELTVLRLGPRRCLIGTVRLLEGMNSPVHRLNLFRSLTPGNLVIGAHFVEVAIWMALIMAGSWLMPESWMPWHEGMIGLRDYFSNGVPPGELDKFGLLVCGSYFIAATVGELLYAAASFGCYLNVRTEVEGWDVEILFKRLTQRLQRAAGVVSMLLVLGCVLAVCSPATARAAEESPADRNAPIARQVTADEDFKIHRGESFRALEREEQETRESDDSSSSGGSRRSPDALSAALTGGSSTIAITLVVIVAALLIAWIVKTNWKGGSGPRERAALRTVAGMDVSVESLPTDPLSVARRLYAAGEPREALSLLYRSALSWLVHRADVAFRESDTEGDCLRRTDGLVHHSYFRVLTRAWQDTAYAAMPPQPPAWENLCAAWPFHEQTGAAPGASERGGPTRPGGAALAGTAAMLLCFFLSACGDNLKGQKVEETYGFRGEARTNHFLALERFASRTGSKVTSSFSLLKSLHGDEHRVLVVTPAVLQSRTHADELMKAVDRGRHAIVAMTDLWDFEETGWEPTRVIKETGAPEKEPMMLLEDDWDYHRRRRNEMERDKLRPEDDDERASAPPGEKPVMRTLRRRAAGLGHLLQQFRVEVTGKEDDFGFGEVAAKLTEKARPEAEADAEADADVEKPEEGAEEADDEPDPAEYEESAATIRRLENAADWGNTFTFQEKRGWKTKTSRVLVLSRGYGSITFVPSLRPFTNLRLAKGGHATLWTALVDGNGTAAIVRGGDISLWDLVKEQGWRPLIGCILALILWLWACQRRFGLRQRAEVTELLSSAGALQASGEFLWSHGLTAEMIHVWQERIRSRWRLAGHAADALVPGAAAVTGLSEQQVAECFAPLKRLGQRQFTELARRLHKIETSF